MRTTQKGQVYYYNTQLGTSTWHDPRVPRDLGDVNPEELGALPPGWELRFTRSSRPYFLNHISRTTQFTDPRLANQKILNNILKYVLLCFVRIFKLNLGMCIKCLDFRNGEEIKMH